MTNRSEHPAEETAPEGASKVLLEGKLLKLSRKKVWQERHFAFKDDHTLTYSHGTNRPNASFRITKDSGCHISEMFVEQRGKKELLYCFTITWERDEFSELSIANESIHETANDDISYNASSQPDTPRSIYSSGNASRSGKQLQQQLDVTLEPPNVAKRKFFGKKSRPRRTQSLDDGYDGDSLSSTGTPGNNSASVSGSCKQSQKSPTVGVPSVPPFVKMDVPESFPDYKSLPDSPKTGKSSHQPHNGTPENRDTLNSKGRIQKAPEDRIATEQEILEDAFFDKEKRNKKDVQKKVIEGTKLAAVTSAAVGFGVLTAGTGVAAGLVVLGAAAAAGGTAGVADFGLKKLKKPKGVLTVATVNFELAKLWKSSLDAYLASDSIRMSTWAQKYVAEGRKTIGAVVPYDIEIKTVQSKSKDAQDNLSEREQHLFLRDSTFFGHSAQWQPLEGGWTSMFGPGAQSLRIFKERKVEVPTKSKKAFRLAIVGAAMSAPLKARVILNVHPLDAFMCLMSNSRMDSREIKDKGFIPKSGHSASFRVIEKIDDHSDIIHLFCRKLYLFPSWTVPRDFVLFRYWRFEPDGSYFVCYESVEHPECPPQPGFVRGIMHQVSTLAPAKKPLGIRMGQVSTGPECMLTTVVQVEPRGWVPARPILLLSNQTYVEAFGISVLLQMLDIRDAIESDRFVDVSPDLNIPKYGSKAEGDEGKMVLTGSSNELMSYDVRYADREIDTSIRIPSKTLCGFENYPPSLNNKKWAEPDANLFLVRGPTYLKNRKKVNAGESIGRLVAVDLVSVDQPILSGMALHPTERIQQALKKERELLNAGKQSDMPPFIFLVNIVLPGPPFYHAVFYYAVDDMSTIDGSNGTGSSKLCKEFLFGDSDGFRDKTFKLIPQIVEGNFMVRKAVGSTPAIMGTKLAQYYSRSDRFLEVILDCGSSQVATGVIRLSLGYAKSLMVDMGFLLEAGQEDYLPERIFGCARMKFPEFGPEYVRKVEATG